MGHPISKEVFCKIKILGAGFLKVRKTGIEFRDVIKPKSRQKSSSVKSKRRPG